MIWDQTVTISGKDIYIPNDVAEVIPDEDIEERLLTPGMLVSIVLTSGNVVQYITGTDDDLDEALQEILDPW